MYIVMGQPCLKNRRIVQVGPELDSSRKRDRCDHWRRGGGDDQQKTGEGLGAWCKICRQLTNTEKQLQYEAKTKVFMILAQTCLKNRKIGNTYIYVQGGPKLDSSTKGNRCDHKRRGGRTVKDQEGTWCMVQYMSSAEKHRCRFNALCLMCPSTKNK